jgi:hypothetical protein
MGGSKCLGEKVDLSLVSEIDKKKILTKTSPYVIDAAIFWLGI